MGNRGGKSWCAKAFSPSAAMDAIVGDLAFAAVIWKQVSANFLRLTVGGKLPSKPAHNRMLYMLTRTQ